MAAKDCYSFYTYLKIYVYVLITLIYILIAVVLRFSNYLLYCVLTFKQSKQPFFNLHIFNVIFN